jgi:hypothetical protein
MSQGEILIVILDLSSHISNLTQLQTLNLTNNHLEVLLIRFCRNLILVF